MSQRRHEEPTKTERTRESIDGFGDRRKEMLEDIAILTGGTVISSAVDLPPLRSAATAQARRCRPQHAWPEREDQHRLLWLRTPLNQFYCSEQGQHHHRQRLLWLRTLLNQTNDVSKGDSEMIKARVGQIKAQIEKTTRDWCACEHR